MANCNEKDSIWQIWQILDQVFYMGDGSVQSLVVPIGATRLFLGTDDGFGWNKNTGFYDVTLQNVTPPSSVPDAGSTIAMLETALGMIGLPKDFPAAIAIVMHLAPDHESLLAEILKWRTHLQVTQAHTGDVLVPSKVFVAPPNHHLFVVKGDRLKLSSSQAEKIHFARPSAEPLFASVAEVYGKNAIAVVLTGGDGDGSFGVQIIKDKGGTVIAQDRPTSENFSMPETSIRTGDVDYILPLNQIAAMLISLIRTSNQSKNGRSTAKNK